MDIISRAIKRGAHLCKCLKIEEQTWEFFFKNMNKKKVFLFGTTDGTEYFIRNCSADIEIEGVIDNDKCRQKVQLGVLCGDAWNSKYSALIVQSPDVLDNYCTQDIAVLITSMNNYVTIVEQMRLKKIDKCFSLIMMEANRRQNILESEEECFEEIRNRYVEWCCSQELKENKIIMLVSLYGGHARQITYALLKEKKEIDIVWIISHMDIERPKGVRIVFEKNWKQYIYEMETAKIWIFDDLVPYFLRKRRDQIYIQTKHWSSITLKKFYLDDKAFCKNIDEREKVLFDGGRMDYVFTGSEFDEESCRNGFMFKGKAIRVGSARSDVLFDKTVKEKVLIKFGLERKTKVCLFVPTYRQREHDRKCNVSISLDMKALLKVLKDKWGGTWYLFVRLHPCLGGMENIFDKDDNIINAGSYPNSEELVAASDIMIADYSSIMFEGAYKKEPIFLYAPDRKEYVEGERDLLIDYDKLPFPIAESNEELHQRIKDFEIEEYKKNVVEFLDSYNVHEDGHASERAAKFIIELLKSQ